MPDLTYRQREAEWMDEPGADPAELERSLRFIRRINRLLGYTKATLSHLDRFAAGWKPNESITMIDFATGSADVPLAILKWADRRGHDVRIVGMDLHGATASAALAAALDASRACCNGSRLSIVRGDAMSPPFADRSFDYALTSMFLHHLDEDAVVRVLGQMARVARRGVIVADLLRSRRAYTWICLFTACAGPMVRHDARVSVRQAFVREEVLSLRDRAGVGFAGYHKHFGHRFVLAGEKRPG